MVLILIGIAAVWLTIAIPCALLFARMATLNEKGDLLEEQEATAPELQVLHAPLRERGRAA